MAQTQYIWHGEHPTKAEKTSWSQLKSSPPCFQKSMHLLLEINRPKHTMQSRILLSCIGAYLM